MGTVQSISMGTISLTAIHATSDLNKDLRNICCTGFSIVNRSELKTMFPNANVTEYPSANDLLSALKDGRSSCIVVPNARLETIRDSYDIRDYEIQELSRTAELSCLMRRGNPELLSIVNKGIINAGESLSASNYSSTSYSAQESDAFRFIYRHRSSIVVIIVGVLLTGVAVLTWALQRARVEQNKALAANAAKMAFLARMSHDIRTPLNGILGSSKLKNCTKTMSMPPVKTELRRESPPTICSHSSTTF